MVAVKAALLIFVSTCLLSCGGTNAPERSGLSDGALDDATDGGTDDSAAATGAGTDANPGDAGPANPDEGTPSSTYPAYQPDFGQIVNDNGYVMRNPVLVPITWDLDPAQPTFDAFVDAVGGSAYFKGELLTLTSNLAGVRHYMPIWIAGE